MRFWRIPWPRACLCIMCLAGWLRPEGDPTRGRLRIGCQRRRQTPRVVLWTASLSRPERPFTQLVFYKEIPWRDLPVVNSKSWRAGSGDHIALATAIHGPPHHNGHHAVATVAFLGGGVKGGTSTTSFQMARAPACALGAVHIRISVPHESSWSECQLDLRSA